MRLYAKLIDGPVGGRGCTCLTRASDTTTGGAGMTTEGQLSQTAIAPQWHRTRTVLWKQLCAICERSVSSLQLLSTFAEPFGVVILWSQ
jgi:hypothetical protein